MGLQGRLVAVAELSPLQRDRMFALMDRHYAGMNRRTFDADLEGKDWAIVLDDARGGEIFGFSTQMVFEAEADGHKIRGLFSGDTIIAKEHWGRIDLMRVWGRLALELIDAAPARELYWFLIAKGYKTYRFLPIFFFDYFPRREVSGSKGLRPICDLLARRLFADRYDAARGVFRADGDDACRLRPGVAELSPARLRDPDVRFFDTANPGHAQGDELCCVAPLTRANFTPAAYRAIGAEARVPMETA